MTPTRPLILSKLFETNEEDRNLFDLNFLAIRIGIGKLNPIYLGHQIDPIGRTPQLNHGLRLKKVLSLQI